MKKILLTFAFITIMNVPAKVDASPVLTFNDYSDGTKTLNESYGSNANSPSIYDYFEVTLDTEPVTQNSMIKITSSQCNFWSDRDGNIGQSYSVLVGPATGGSYSNGKTLRTAAVALDDSVYEGNHSCTVTATVISDDLNFSGLTANKTFSITDNDTKPAETAQPTAPKSTTNTSANTTSTEAEVQKTADKPDVPNTKFVDNEGNELKTDEGTDKITFKNSEPIVISGVTVPNGLVKLYIFSEPQEAEVIADVNGNWTYTIMSIEPGDHRVEVEVTDPATNETSERAEVLAFSVAQTDKLDEMIKTNNDSAQSSSEDNSTLFTIIVVASFLVLTCVGSGIWFWNKKKNKTSNNIKNNVVNTDLQPKLTIPDATLDKNVSPENLPKMDSDKNNLE